MDLTTALCAAIGGETTALVVLFWLYVNQRNAQDKRGEVFVDSLVPLLTSIKEVMQDTRDLLRQFVTRSAS